MDVIQEYGSLKGLAAEIRSIKQDFEEMCANLNTLVDSLDGEWQGKAQTEFSSSYLTLKDKLQAMSEALRNFSDAVELTALNTSEADNSTTF